MDIIYKERLLKLSKKLTTLPQKYFDISSFRSNVYGSCVPYVSKHECGTIGCALGWAPVVKGLEPISSDFEKDEWADEKQLVWEKYCFRVFGISQSEDIWEFLFSGLWDCIDNTPKGAAARILYAIETDGNLEELQGYDGDGYSAHINDVSIYNLENI